jgi:hypothetical protein
VARRQQRETSLIRLFGTSVGRPASLRVLGPVVVVAAVAAAGCGTTGAAPAPSSPASPASGGTTSFRQCLEQHGVQPPAGRPAGGAPHTPPAGAASGAFRKALQACGGGRGSFPGHGG